MGISALDICYEESYESLAAKLNQSSEYWIKHDIWKLTDPALSRWKIVKCAYKTDMFLDFSCIKTEGIKVELKFYIYQSITEGNNSASTVYNRFKKVLERIEPILIHNQIHSL